ncbi:MAG: hypothetical protein GY942_15495 [Aestuariibacter sp.]|nr:hypothetical protein [Aestuariibacter sp.]
MTTVNDLLAQSLREVGVIRQDQTPTASQLAKGIIKLNQMLDDWFRDGIDLGWYPVTAGVDTLRLDDRDELGVMYNFAVVLAGEYGAPIQEITATEATRTKRRLIKSTVSIVESDLSQLPGVSTGRYNINSG